MINQHFSYKNLLLFLLLTIFFLSIFLFIDILEIDNFLYHFFNIKPQTIYYDLNIWNFYQAIGTLGAFIFGIFAIIIAYQTWTLESKPNIQAIGNFLISVSEDTNGVRDSLQDEFNPEISIVNVGRGPAQNITLSVSENIKGFLLESMCPDTFPLPGNSESGIFNLNLLIHGQRFVENDKFALSGNRNEKYFFIHYYDHIGTEHITKVVIEKVTNFEHIISDAINENSDNLQFWKITKNLKIK